MLLAMEQPGFAIQLATVVVPVAIYFLILGLLNSRHQPQLLSGRQDFALLAIALSPLVVLPIVSYLGTTLTALCLVILALAGAVGALSPRGANWVVYNMQPQEARNIIACALRSLGLSFDATEDGFSLADGRSRVHISGFPLLRNVSIRLVDSDTQLGRRFETALVKNLAHCRCETSPMAMGLTLVATTMLVAPLMMAAQHMPQIVRVLTDLVPLAR